MAPERSPAASHREVRDLQIEPIAGIWACPNCGRSIQVITESDVPKVQSFVCVCGTPMEPGEEHKTIAEDRREDNQTRVVDE